MGLNSREVLHLVYSKSLVFKCYLDEFQIFTGCHNVDYVTLLTSSHCKLSFYFVDG